MDITVLTFDDRDEFKRKGIAEKAISLLQADINISPIVIDGSWGTGKTEFCHKLINLMQGNNSHNLIYIDAFKADHADDPLMTVLAEVIKVLPDDESKQGFMKKALPAVRYGFKASAKAVVAHALKQDFADVADDFDKEIQKAADKAIDATVESVLKDHVKAEKNLKALQNALADIATIKPIVLFVDELDRCRPNFAVDMLEIIKHTFDVEGVGFVLITNTKQLKASINHCYGHAVDAQRYLDKFVKFTIESPRVCQRLNNLRNWNYEKIKSLYIRIS
ncbi:P-loop NTPase fold protein, partial [Pseudoalteromonas sp. S983]|uniref:KAP family P-loop NTPase fold protein n=1 Tax=Pseudoalteromonas sp. S983 TaxID=579572 RepID=UPI0012756C74